MMASSPLAWMVAAAVLASAWVSQVAAHGKLTSPASRNHIDGNAGCSHCLNGGGPCGSSKFLNFKTDPQATWTEGSVVPITILVTAHHMGHYEFRICDQVLDGSISNPDACLNKWVMERASPEEAGFTDCSPGDDRPACVPVDPKHPERWYLPPRSEISGSHTIYFKVPVGLQCQACTLQWHWWSANSCQPAGDYGCFKQILQNNGYWTGGKAAWWTAFGGSCSGPAGPNGHSGCGEQFWNCADIKVLPGNGSPTPTQLPTPMPTPVLAPSPPPMPSPVVSPTPTMTCEDCATMFSNPCIWNDGRCNPILREMCISQPGARWCGESTSTTATSRRLTTTATIIPTITTTTVAGRFQAVDGGVNRACRGASSGDNSASYYTLQAGVTSLDDCKARCVATRGCNGIEHHASSNRCEVWTRSGGIQASRVLNGYTCLTYSAVRGTTTTTTMMVGSFRAVDGGEGRACRGASASDNSASYYDLRGGVATLEDCKANCLTTNGCTGIEYSPSAQRCEIWTRSIEASRGVSGFECFRLSSGGCQVRPGGSSGATVEDCKRTCDILEAEIWPCSSDGPCDCSSSIAFLTETRRIQLRGRARHHLAAGLGFIQNSTAVTVRAGQNEGESCSA